MNLSQNHYSREHPVPGDPLRLWHELPQGGLDLLERGAHRVGVKVEGEVDVLLELPPDLLALLHKAPHAAVLEEERKLSRESLATSYTIHCMSRVTATKDHPLMAYALEGEKEGQPKN